MDTLPPYAPPTGQPFNASAQGVADNEDLPSYDQRGSAHNTRGSFVSTKGINDGLPPTYRIGTKYTPPLVRPSDLQAHLVLLGAFHRLYEEVRTQKGPGSTNTPENLWTIFLERAVHRFELWVTRMIDVIAAEEESEGHVPQERQDGYLDPDRIPPLDVIMVWHTYMLNPSDYYEDCLRMHGGLRSIGSFPLLQLAASIDQETLLPLPPLERQSAAWKSFTSQTFNPPLMTTMRETRSVHCPNCSTRNSVNWLTDKGHGYAQRGFAIICYQCSMPFGREALCARRFYEDVEKCIVNSEKHVLAKTLVDWATGMPDPALARVLTALLLSFEKNPVPQRPEELGQMMGWRHGSVERICRIGFMNAMDKPYLQTPRPVNIILSAYQNTGPFSIDLASAVMRQMSFVEKIVGFGWSEHDRFEDDRDTLTRCVSRYHAFLDLMATTPGLSVPTLDIDLAWHTHQLLCESYRTLGDIMDVIPDHDDKVTQSAIAEAYDQTAEAWKARFSVPYSVCGCIPPSAVKPSGSTGIKSAFSLKGKKKATEKTVVNNPRPDLISVEEMHGDETHPSEHNSVTIINPPIPSAALTQVKPEEQSAGLAQTRRAALDKRTADLDKLVQKGKTDDWIELQSKRGGTGGSGGHPHAFLCPVQYGVKAPFGAYGHGDCAVYSGGALAGPLGAGDCANGNGHNGQCAAQFGQVRGGLQQAINTGIVMTGRKTLMRDLGLARINQAEFFMHQL